MSLTEATGQNTGKPYKQDDRTLKSELATSKSKQSARIFLKTKQTNKTLFLLVVIKMR